MVRYERRDGVAVIVIDNPPVNTLFFCTTVSGGIAVALVREFAGDRLRAGLGQGNGPPVHARTCTRASGRWLVTF
jgi:hypothetical protein